MKTTEERNRIITQFMGVPKPTLKEWSKVRITADCAFFNMIGVANGYKTEDKISITLPSDGSRWFEYDDFEVIDEREYNYHSSWDALMPVVDKIETTLYTIPKGKNSGKKENVEISTMYDNRPEYLGWSFVVEFVLGPGISNKNVTYSTKFEATYNAVIEFIEWYNEQNETHLRKKQSA